MSTVATASSAREGVPRTAARGRIARYRQRLFRVDPTDREPVVLRHNRIYMLPTRRGLAFIGTIATMLVLSLNYSLSLGFAVTFMLTGLVGAALLHTFRNLLGLELRPLAAGECFAGDPLPFTLAIGAGPAPRVAIALGIRECPAVDVDVVAESTRPVVLERPAAARGRCALGRVTVSTTHPLGIWRGWAYVHFPLEGIVYPAPELAPPPLPLGTGGDDLLAGARGEDADLAGLRAYQPGDPLQRIAWKAVARGAGWHTKQFDGAGGGGPVHLAWHSLPAALDAEARLARMCAWVLAAERAARPFTLNLPGVALPAGQGRDHRRAALTALALCDAPAR